MKGKYTGVMTVEDLFQSLYQDTAFFRSHGIQFIKSACLYFTPCDEHGDTVVVRNAAGEVVDGYMSAGAYPCAARHYEEEELDRIEPVAVARPVVMRMSFPKRTT